MQYYEINTSKKQKSPDDKCLDSLIIIEKNYLVITICFTKFLSFAFTFIV